MVTFREQLEMVLAGQIAEDKPRKKPSEEEHHLQCACVKWFNMQYPQYRGLLFAVPNGGARSKATAGKLKAEGVVPGVSDLILLVPSGQFHGLCIEMKTQKGKQSDAQKEWMKVVKKAGYCYALCRSLDEFINDIKTYLLYDITQ